MSDVAQRHEVTTPSLNECGGASRTSTQALRLCLRLWACYRGSQPSWRDHGAYVHACSCSTPCLPVRTLCTARTNIITAYQRRTCQHKHITARAPRNVSEHTHAYRRSPVASSNAANSLRTRETSPSGAGPDAHARFMILRTCTSASANSEQ